MDTLTYSYLPGTAMVADAIWMKANSTTKHEYDQCKPKDKNFVIDKSPSGYYKDDKGIDRVFAYTDPTPPGVKGHIQGLELHKGKPELGYIDTPGGGSMSGTTEVWKFRIEVYCRCPSIDEYIPSATVEFSATINTGRTNETFTINDGIKYKAGTPTVYK